MDAEIVGQYASVQQVDDAILRRYLELVEDANPEDLSKLLDSWAKYISARKNSDVFAKEETEAERAERLNAEAIAKAMGGEA